MLTPGLALLTQIAISRPLNSVTAGTSVQAGSSVDMQGYEGVLFIMPVGALTSTQVTSLKASQSADDSSFADLENTSVGPLADADGNKMLVLDIYMPEKRYVKPTAVRGTANAVLDGIIAIRYGARSMPTTQPSVVSASESHVTPAEGTA